MCCAICYLVEYVFASCFSFLSFLFVSGYLSSLCFVLGFVLRVLCFFFIESLRRFLRCIVIFFF